MPSPAFPYTTLGCFCIPPCSNIKPYRSKGSDEPWVKTLAALTSQFNCSRQLSVTQMLTHSPSAMVGRKFKGKKIKFVS